MNYRQFLSSCDALYQMEDCAKTSTKQCQACFNSEFYSNNAQNAYGCYAGCLYYTMHYGLSYISEIYYLIESVSTYDINFFNGTNITSLGGGFGTDYLAIKKYAIDNRMPFNIRYSVYDISPKWENIISLYNAENSVCFSTCDVSQQFIDLSLQQIVFINKLVSTLKASHCLMSFLNNLTRMLQTLPPGSILIFNDVNHCEKGRDDFLRHMANRHPEMQLLGKYFFPIADAYTGDYTPINNTNIVFDISYLNLSCKIMNTVRKTFFAIYRKAV